MKRLFILGTLLNIACIGSANALEVKPGGTIFAHYEYVASQNLKDGTTTQGLNNFDVSRIYLNSEVKYDDKVSGYINLEADLVSRESKNNRVFLKNAELRYAWNDMAKVYFGLIGLPWRAGEEAVWTRFVAKDLEDTEGIGNATDRGIKFNGKIPYLAYNFLVVNGEGTGADSTSGNESTVFGNGGRLKDFVAMVSVSPLEKLGVQLKGLKINLQGLKGDKDEFTLRNRIFAGLSYDSSLFRAAANYYNADNSAASAPSRGEGISIYGLLFPIPKFWAAVRFDHYNPNINAGGFSHNRYLWSLGYELNKYVRLSLDEQYLEQETRTKTLQDENIFFVHTETKF